MALASGLMVGEETDREVPFSVLGTVGALAGSTYERGLGTES